MNITSTIMNNISITIRYKNDMSVASNVGDLSKAKVSVHLKKLTMFYVIYHGYMHSSFSSAWNVYVYVWPQEFLLVYLDFYIYFGLLYEMRKYIRMYSLIQTHSPV